jgi:hypothetical protein
MCLWVIEIRVLFAFRLALDFFVWFFRLSF